MKNLLNEGDRTRLFERLARLSPDSERRFGKMDVGQMVCHLTDPMRIALGDLPAKDTSTFMTRTFLRWMVLAGMPAPKGMVETFPEIDYAKGGGTPPTDLATDLDALRQTTARCMERAQGAEPFVPSPAFGRLSSRAYGRLMYVHMNHHLKQFGV